jgi:hypothetical protein
LVILEFATKLLKFAAITIGSRRLVVISESPIKCVAVFGKWIVGAHDGEPARIVAQRQPSSGRCSTAPTTPAAGI